VFAKVRGILRAFGDDDVALPHELLFDRKALVGKAVVGALMEPAHFAERVERHDERDALRVFRFERRQTRHEEIGVNHVVRPRFSSAKAEQKVGEGRHIG